ncbi:MAG: ABC transporter substrate-binding protein [Myxococcota bacterium]
MRARLGLILLTSACLLGASGCKTQSDEGGGDKAGGDKGAAQGAKKAGSDALIGVDMDKKVVSIGALNDESGPGAAIGKPFANGKRLLVKRINAGGSGLLPDGWTIELVERDHAYNPQQSVQQYNAIKGKVLFIATSFGTPNTLPLRKQLERDGLLAFPASLSSKMAEHPNTPPIAPSYVNEARRAMDWAVQHAGGADKIKAGIVYQKDDYGKDGLDGWKQAAAMYGVEVVAEQTVEPGQKDVTAVVSALNSAGANYVLLTTLPSSTGPVLGTSAQLQYGPVWIGSTPAWIDRFFSPEVIPAAVFSNFYWVSGVPFWGEKLPGMDEFVAAWETHGKDMGEQDSYVLTSYIAGLIQVEALRRAIDSGDLSRAGYMAAMRSIKGWNAGGMIEPIDLTKLPYEPGLRTRILKPMMAEKTWQVVADYAEPQNAPGGAQN